MERPLSRSDIRDVNYILSRLDQLKKIEDAIEAANNICLTAHPRQSEATLTADEVRQILTLIRAPLRQRLLDMGVTP